jgi:anaerobic selenocysteine-containing dehydrogenase/Fe-S-cluster-containing dehydrogenase component
MANGLERREFLKVLGVGGAGGLAACGTGAERLIPYVVPHEEIVPGISTWYRTTCRECPAGCGMSVRTREGRAIKAEGNPLSPISHGKLCARGQAALHGLYNPDRIPQALRRNGEEWERLTWDDAERRLAETLQQQRGRSVFLTQHYTGTMDVLVDSFCTTFGIERVRYEPFAHEALRAGSRLVYGLDAIPVHDFANAEVVITFGADFLETWLSPVDYHVGFIQARAYAAGERGRLIAVSPHQSLTDMNADEWLPIRPGTEHLVALALARLVVDNGGQLTGASAAAVANVQVEQAAQIAGVSTERLRQIAFAFANGGRSLAVGPGIASAHGAATQVAAAVAMLNQAAGNIGTTVRLDRTEEHANGLASYAQMQQLVERMGAGEIQALLVHGPNPLYSLPDRERVREAFERVPAIVSFSTFIDETSERAHLLLPDHHFLESWGDCTPRTGITSLIQPVMTPVFETKQTADVLLSVARRANSPVSGDAPTYYDYLRNRWQQQGGLPAVAGGFEESWREALKAGVVLTGATGAAAAPQELAAAPPPPAATEPAAAPQEPAAAPQEPAAAPQEPADAPQEPAASPPQPAALAAQALAQLRFDVPQFTGGEDDFYLVVYPSYRFYDGRLANRPWLQELPDPVSKFCWSSWVEINPATARRLRLDLGHIVEVETPYGAVELPVWPHPGTLEDVIAIQIGQGHESFGAYAQDRGVNPLRLIGPVVEDASGGLAWQQTRATLRPTGKWRRPITPSLVNDQAGRGIARAMTLEEARAADHRRGLAVVGGTEAAAHVPEPDYDPHDPHFEPHPQDDVLTQLQGSGGWAPSIVDGRPQGFPPAGTHYGEYSEDRPRWAMTIDMERCTGCSACVTACYAENNIAVVGPEGVAKGRILNWMRIERYFEGDEDTLETRFLPMLCQHCNNAPCEPVCPVYAAYHTPDGLNAQVYNRCVGTRYCANNCPYKVRVFNWFSYAWPEPLNWQLNPDVTVREKGVMEKCTFCVQRIREAEDLARMQGRGTVDGEIVPACAQTCPGEAIVFGNIKDPNSRVARLAASGRGYRVLQGLNTQSAITYLKRISEHATAEEH